MLILYNFYQWTENNISMIPIAMVLTHVPMSHILISERSPSISNDASEIQTHIPAFLPV